MRREVEWSDIDATFKKTANGEIAIVRGTDAIMQSIMIYLSTMRGEFIRSRAGSGLFRMLFEKVTEETAEDIEDMLRESIPQIDNRVNVRNVNVTAVPQQNMYTLSLDYSVFPSRAVKSIEIPLQAFGE